jgi:hypothetical protein
MVIGITLNEVLRDYLGQFHYTYRKYVNDEPGFKPSDITDFDLSKKYEGFESKADLNSFLYEFYALEVFGHADQTQPNAMNKFNQLVMDVEDEENGDSIRLISREFNASIPSTNFFLSKLGCKARDIKYVVEHEDKWTHADILITANPITLNAKPEGKKAIKVLTSYNQECEADYTVLSPLSILDFEELTKIIKKIDD